MLNTECDANIGAARERRSADLARDGNSIECL